MTDIPGLPPGFTWAPLVPELIVSDLERSLEFWRDLLGFGIAYDRPEDGFVYLDLAGAQIMLEERSEAERQWIAAELKQPFGRGVNFQTQVADLNVPLGRLLRAGWPLFMDVEEKWYRAGAVKIGVSQCIVQDPDGYLVRLSCPIGQRLVGAA